MKVDKKQTCPKCRRTKNIKHFEIRKDQNGYRRKQCKRCRYDNMLLWYRLPSVRYAASKGKAKLRKIGWKLTQKDFFALITHGCHYCGGKLPETSTGLDRMNSNKGYHKDNVVPCCSTCNVMKSDKITYAQMVEIRHHLIKWRIEREK